MGRPFKHHTDEERIAAARASRAKYRSTPEGRKQQRDYYLSNRDAIYARKVERLRTDLCFRIRHNLRTRLRQAIRRKSLSGSAVRDLGCSIRFFMGYISSKFKEGMSWDNWGEWHLDHIKPLCNFDLTAREQLLEACHYTNMQPLWANENMAKNRWAA